jgi:hypothetical protein
LKNLLLQAFAKHKATGLSYFESGTAQYVSGDSYEAPAQAPDLRLISLLVDILTMLAQAEIDIAWVFSHRKLQFLGISAEAIADELLQANFELNIEPAYFEQCCWCCERTGCGEFCRVCLTSREGLPYDIASAVENVSGRKVRTMEDLFFLSPVENHALKEIDLCQFALKMKQAPDYVLNLPRFDEPFLCRITELLAANDISSISELPLSSYRKLAIESGLKICSDMMGDSRDLLMLARHCRHRQRFDEAFAVLRLALAWLRRKNAPEAVGARMLLLKELESWDAGTGMLKKVKALIEHERSLSVASGEAERWCFCHSCAGLIAMDAHGCRFCRLPSVKNLESLWLEQFHREKLAGIIRQCASWTPHFYYLVSRLPNSPLKVVLDNAIAISQSPRPIGRSLAMPDVDESEAGANADADADVEVEVNVDSDSDSDTDVDEVLEILGETDDVPGCAPGLQVSVLIVEMFLALTQSGSELATVLEHPKMRFLNITFEGLKTEIARRALEHASAEGVRCHWCASLIFRDGMPCRYCGAHDDDGFSDEIIIAPTFLRRFPSFDTDYLRSIVFYSAVQAAIKDDNQAANKDANKFAIKNGHWQSLFAASLEVNEIAPELVEQEVARVKSHNSYRFPCSTYRRLAVEAGLVVRSKSIDTTKELIALAVQCRKRRRFEDWLLVMKFALMLFPSDFSLPGFRATQILITGELREGPDYLEEVQELKKQQCSCVSLEHPGQEVKHDSHCNRKD